LTWPWRGSPIRAGSGRAAAGSGPGSGPCARGAGIGDPLPVTGHGEVLDAEIDADRMAGLLQGLRSVGIDGEGRVPAAVRLPGDDHHRRLQRGHVHVRPRPHERQWRIGLGQPQDPAAHRERRPGVVGGLPGASGLEPRVAGALLKRARNALCWWRSACWSGTDDTSFRNASSGSFFIWVSARSVSAYEVPLRSRCQWACRAARVRFHTTRTQPNVRFSTACCFASGYARHRYAVLTFTGWQGRP